MNTEESSAMDDDDRRHHIDAVHFVHHAIKHAMRHRDEMVDGKVSGSLLCRVLLELSVDEFGAEGKDVLMQWNLVDGQDVRLIVRRMVQAEVQEASCVDVDSSYAGLFDLQQPPDSWGLKW